MFLTLLPRVHALRPLRSLGAAAWLGLSVLGGLAASPAAQAQTAAAVAPYYTAGDFMRSIHRFWFAPQAAAFAEHATALPQAVSAICSASPATAGAALTQARNGWKATALAWDRLSGVQIGPLVQRRSARQIDFTPTRPELIKRAIDAAPADATAMESIGTPAKGLPALEWLLWTQPIAPDTPACAYAVQVATDIQREAQALSAEFAALAARQPGQQEDTNLPALSELVNQWTGGLERLRWAEMEKPRLAVATGGAPAAGARHAALYARSASGQTAARWAAQWQALRALGISPDRAAITPGSRMPSLETYMRGLGRDAPADQLVKSMDKADKALRQLTPAKKTAVAAAARSLAEVKKVAEADVAPAMEVSIGFSDADGD